MSFHGLLKTETDNQERARLAEAPEGSINHELAALQVLNPHPGRGQVLELTRDYHGQRIVVMPLEFVPGRTSDAKWHNTAPERRPIRQHDGWWHCIVLASTHDSYPAGGHDLSISTCELRRARCMDLLDLTTSQS